MLINSLQNSFVKKMSSLDKKKYRDKYGLYLAAGNNQVEEAIKNEMCEHIITTDLNYGKEGIDIKYVTEDVMFKIYPQKPIVKHLAVCKINYATGFDTGKIIVLNKISDPGNLGTILRTARAFGFIDVFIDENGVDLYNAKVVRAMQGVQHTMNFIIGDSYEYLVNTNLPIITTYLDEDKTYTKGLESNYNLVFGNEGLGIDKKIKNLKHSNYLLDIDYESLNVAIAAGIIMEHLK